MDAVLGWNLVLSLPVILAIAWLAGRLLGVSRSWAGTVLAGVAGWLAALALSLAIAQGDTGAPGFTRNLWVFAAVFTMSASVWSSCWPSRAPWPGSSAGWCRSPILCGRSAAPVEKLLRSSLRQMVYVDGLTAVVDIAFGPTAVCTPRSWSRT